MAQNSGQGGGRLAGLRQAATPGSGGGRGGRGGRGGGSSSKLLPLLIAAVVALVLVGGLIAAVTSGSSDPTALPDELSGQPQVESEQLTASAEPALQAMRQAGVEEPQSAFYGPDPSQPTVFLARGALPSDSQEDPTRARMVLDGVERGMAAVFETLGPLSAAKPPGGNEVRCGNLDVPSSGPSTLCAFQDGKGVSVYTMYRVPPASAQQQVTEIRQQLSPS